jgi:pimeloyl-ACP methyl ester carboxylesterase
MRVLNVAGAGLNLAADAYGPEDGPGVLLFHGGGQTRHAWGGTSALLGEHGWRTLNVDLRGHGDSDWAADADYTLDAFTADVRAVALAQPAPPAIVGASLGGLGALLAIAEAPEPERVASALVLVDVAPKLELAGINRISEFMLGGADGFASLEDVADAVAAYQPHRPRPADLTGLRKNVRQRPDGRWYWHWDPAFITRNPAHEPEEFADSDRLDDAARSLRLPTLLVRGRLSDVVSEDGARHLLELVPHARYVDVGDAGHMVAGDRNDAFNDAVAAFLAERQTQTTPPAEGRRK